MFTGKRRSYAGPRLAGGGWAERYCDGCNKDLTPAPTGGFLGGSQRVRMPRHMSIQFAWQGSLGSGERPVEQRTIHLCIECVKRHGPHSLAVFSDMLKGA